MKTNFENLQIYRLAETSSDLIWKIVARWEIFAKDIVGKQLVRAADSIGAILPKEVARERLKIIVDIYVMRVVRCMKQDTG
jgi:hypothetical protein